MYRWMVLTLLLSGIATSGYFRRRAYAAGGRILACAGLGLIAFLGIVIPKEERELVARFGEEYRT